MLTEVNASPLAIRVAKEEGIDLSTLKGTGPGGRIVRADVRAALEKRAATLAVLPLATVPAASLPLTSSRGAVARKLSANARTTAHVTLSAEVDAGELVSCRTALRSSCGELASAITDELLIAVIAARALREHPQVNASLTENGIVQHEHINIGVAMDTEQGYLILVLKDVPSRHLLDLAADLKAQVAGVFEGRITPDDLTGATFTVTNLGQFGVDAFTPIINLPECAILGMGRIVNKPVVRNGDIVVGQTLVLSLTFDHRVVDGAPAARFLQCIAQLTMSPPLAFSS